MTLEVDLWFAYIGAYTFTASSHVCAPSDKSTHSPKSTHTGKTLFSTACSDGNRRWQSGRHAEEKTKLSLQRSPRLKADSIHMVHCSGFKFLGTGKEHLALAPSTLPSITSPNNILSRIFVLGKNKKLRGEKKKIRKNHYCPL